MLEVGCGSGLNADWYRDHGASQIVGIEPDANAAAEAAERFDTVGWAPAKTLRESLSDIWADAVERTGRSKPIQ